MTATHAGTIGDVLRRRREQKGLSIEDAHRDTRISVPMIRALEEDDHDVFDSEVYLKGFLRQYAAYLGLDGDQLWRDAAARAGRTDAGEATWDEEAGLVEERITASPWPRRIFVGVLLGVIAVLLWLLSRRG